MNEKNLKEELERERQKLSSMINEAMENNRPVLENEEILKQSRKVDALLNRLQKQRDRGQSR
ncbi:MAG: hypothetical protein PHO15_05595 [Eubacteriales bacterium]|nr:hypothetical protein [Eubacteriales bacterium]